MKTRLLPILCLAALGLSAMASADRVYYLVGLRHVYSVPVFPDPHELDRQAIEEDFAGVVAQAQKQYDTDMESIHDEEAKDGGNLHQVDRDAVQENLEKAVADAAEKRDADLVSLYPQVDDVRRFHSEFKVDQDGPYKVVGIDTSPRGEYVNIVYYRPYPTYYEPCPFGWGWGRPYAYSTWSVQIGIFHSTWISIGCPVYEPMCYGGVVFVVDAPIRTEVICTRERWVGGFPPHLTERQRREIHSHREIQERSHYYDRVRQQTIAAGGLKIKAPLAPPAPARIVAPGLSAYTHRVVGTQPQGIQTNSGGSRYGRGNGAGPLGSNSTGPSRYGRQPGSEGGASTTGTSKYSRSPGGSGTSGSSGAGNTSIGSTSSRYGRTPGGSGSATRSGIGSSGSSSAVGSSSTAGSRYGRSPAGSGVGGSSAGSSTGSATSGGSRYGRSPGGSGPSGSSTGSGSSSASGGSRYGRPPAGGSGTTNKPPSGSSSSSKSSGSTGSGNSGSQKKNGGN